MKKLLIATAILSATILWAAVGQKITITHLGSDGCVTCRKIAIEGHDYIVTTAVYGISTVHSESCPCKACK